MPLVNFSKTLYRYKEQFKYNNYIQYIANINIIFFEKMSIKEHVQNNLTKDQIKTLKQKYKELVVLWPNIDYCDNCLEQHPLTNTEGETDECVYCDLCDGMCHQRCYGGQLYKYVPDGQWFCERCQYLVDKFVHEDSLACLDEIRCEYCPNLRGVLKQFKVSGKKVWSHLCCIEMLFGRNFVNK